MKWDVFYVNYLRSDDEYRKAANIYYVCTGTLFFLLKGLVIDTT